ncbi:DUF5009 domain-containing protein [soil metagenome]
MKNSTLAKKRKPAKSKSSKEAPLKKKDLKDFSVGVSTSNRLLSLDLFRGATMFLLVAESTRLYNHFTTYTSEPGFLHSLALQFHHHPWNGLRFWDLIQPFFMFIVGVAMVFSLTKRVSRPRDWSMATHHIIKRCFILFFLGVLLHCVYSGTLVWELWNVLTQLAFTILIAFSLFKYSLRTQILVSFGLLLLTEILYRFFPVEGFNNPFVMGENFGSWMDMVLMGKINGGGWVVINFLPTAAHTIWGVVAGKILISDWKAIEKVKPLIIAGLIGLVVGYGMDLAGVTPIIKRIATTSFVIVSGGWCLLVLAACYWLVDVLGYKRFVFFFSVVGMNSIFIYMFAETIGHQWLVGFAAIFSEFFLWLNASEATVNISAALIALAINWYLCYWLYKNKIFFKV